MRADFAGDRRGRISDYSKRFRRESRRRLDSGIGKLRCATLNIVHARSNPWKTLASRTVYENAWVRVREDAVVRPDGHEGIYSVVELRASVGVVAINEDREVALVGQWRYPLGRYSWEIPRGGSLPDESDLQLVAERELREETGIEARIWRRLGAVDVNNGVTTDVEHLFLATDIRTGQAHHDPEEELELRWVPFQQAVRMALSGEITEVCTVAAVFLAASI
jgi:8-oxo-dGTP pyrophosphatase MutT (NUDIX family)